LLLRPLWCAESQFARACRQLHGGVPLRDEYNFVGLELGRMSAIVAAGAWAA